MQVGGGDPPPRRPSARRPTTSNPSTRSTKPMWIAGHHEVVVDDQHADHANDSAARRFGEVVTPSRATNDGTAVLAFDVDLSAAPPADQPGECEADAVLARVDSAWS